MHAIGVYVEGNREQRALLCKRKGSIHIEWVTEEKTPPLSPKNTITVSGLEAKDTLVREVQIPLKRRKEILSVLPFQIEPLIPYPLDQAIVLPKMIEKDRSTLLVVATHHTALTKHLEMLHTQQIDATHVSCTPQALVRAVSYFFPDLTSFSVLHFSQENSCFVVAENKSLRLTHALAKDWYLESSSVDVMIERLQAFAKNKLPSLEHPLVLTGDVPEDIPSTLRIPKQYSSFAIPIGYALDALIYKDAVQFRQGKFLSKKTVNKQGIYAVSAFALSCVLAAVCAGFSLSSLDKRKEVIESALRNRGFNSLPEWKLHINSQHPYSPFAKEVPKVADVLTWLSTHPCLNKMSDSGEGIEIASVHYRLEDYPQLSRPHQDYLVHVDIEFTSPSAQLARAFHDSLLSEKDVIDRTKEIGWHVEGSFYRTSFFLTPKFL